MPDLSKIPFPSQGGKIVGYVRVSTVDQNLDRQLEGVPLSKRYEERVSGKDRDRPQLKIAMDYCRDGDLFIVHSMDRLARNLHDLQGIVRELNAKEVSVHFLSEGISFPAGGSANPFDTLQFQLLGAFAEFERALTLARQREGIAVAKRKGKYKGRKPVMDAEAAAKALEMVRAGKPKAQIARELSVGRSTLYRYLDEAVNPSSSGAPSLPSKKAAFIRSSKEAAKRASK